MQASLLPSPADLPDTELAALAARADTGAFEILMRRYNQLLFRTARSILKSDEETQDAVQEAYLNAWRALPTFRSDAKLSKAFGGCSPGEVSHSSICDAVSACLARRKRSSWAWLPGGNF